MASGSWKWHQHHRMTGKAPGRGEREGRSSPREHHVLGAKAQGGQAGSVQSSAHGAGGQGGGEAPPTRSLCLSPLSSGACCWGPQGTQVKQVIPEDPSCSQIRDQALYPVLLGSDQSPPPPGSHLWLHPRLSDQRATK